MRPWRIPILLYHHVEPVPLEPEPLHRASYVSPEELAAALDRLRALGYRTWTLGRAARAARAGQRPARKTVILTFDDGCRCFGEHALPALRAREQTATLFAVAGALGGTNRWDEERGERRETLLSADELADLARSGIEIGSHGCSHRDLTACDDATLATEVAESKERLSSAVGCAVETFCYPYGRVDARVRSAVADGGYLAAVSIHRAHGARRGDPFALPRESIRPGESALELRLKASGAYGRLARLPRLGLLAALRRSPD